MGGNNSKDKFFEDEQHIDEKSTLISNDSHKFAANSRHGKEYDQFEINEIFRLVSCGMSIKELASKYGRSEDSIIHKILDEIYLNSMNEKISLIKCYDLNIDSKKYLEFISVKYRTSKLTQSQMCKNNAERK